MKKFGRLYELTIYPPTYVQTSPGNNPNKFNFNSFGLTEIVTIKNPFTLIFNINKYSDIGSSNIGSFQIYNLGETTRNQIYHDQFNNTCARLMVLKAGYSQPLSTIFSGNIMSCTSYRPSGQNNFITEIQGQEWSFPIQNSYTNVNFSGETQRQKVIDQLVNDLCAMGSPSTTVRLTPGSIHPYTDTQFNRIISGNSWDLLKQETLNKCFIDNNRIHVLEENDCIEGSFPEISSDTGLLGTPKRGEAIVTVEMLFEPTLLVGQQIALNSSSQKIFNGNYKVQNINHAGVISDAIGGRCQSNVTLFSFSSEESLLQPLVGN